MPRHEPHVRKQRANERARATMLMQRLVKHALGQLEKPMDSTQIRAAEIYLKKVRPDLAAIEHSGEVATSAEFTDFLRSLGALNGATERAPAQSSDALAEDAGDLRH